MKLFQNFFFIVTILSIFSCHSEKIQTEIELSERAKEKLFPTEYLFQQRSYPYGTIDQSTIMRSRLKTSQESLNSNRRFIESWEPKGPTNIGGRVTDIEGSITGSTTTLYVGTASGGVFKTTDEGDSWQALFDDQVTLSIGDMALSESDNQLLYVGTGEANAGGGSLAYDGYGIYKTQDGGTSWEHLGLTNIGSIGKVVIDPNDNNTVYVAGMGSLFSPNAERGVFKTTDGGKTWDKVLYITENTGAIDLVIDPNSPNILYAAMWDRIRTPSNRIYGGVNSGIYKTIDGGNSWNRQTNGIPVSEANTNLQIGRIGLSIFKENPEILYATISYSLGPQEGIYKTTTGGNSWTKQDAFNIASVPFMWWFGKIYVHPNDENIVYHPGFVVQRSSNSGQTFEDRSDLHVDQHALWFHPENPEKIYIGNDGGIYSSDDEGSTYTMFPNLPNTQFYTCEIDHLIPVLLYGGTQDNNTIRSQETGSNNDYIRILGGDGFRVIVDPTNSNNIYAESQRGNLRRSTNQGQSWQFALNGIDGTDRNNWNTPVAMDPNDPSTLYYGSDKIYKTTNKAVSWTPISPDLTKGEVFGNLDFATITTIDVSPHNSDHVLIGTDDGNVQITTDGNTWLLISTDQPNRWVTSVRFDPNDTETIYVTYSGFRYGEDISNVYMSENLGESWIKINGNLPETPINNILILPETNDCILATDIGVYISANNSDSWERLGNELPNVVITDLDYHPPTRTLLAATYGRSLFSYTFKTPSSIESVTEIDMLLYPNPAIDYIAVRMEENKKGILLIVDQSGKVILQQKHLGSDSIIDLNGIADGIYFLKYKNEPENTYSIRKFVVSKDK